MSVGVVPTLAEDPQHLRPCPAGWGNPRGDVKTKTRDFKYSCVRVRLAPLAAVPSSQVSRRAVAQDSPSPVVALPSPVLPESSDTCFPPSVSLSTGTEMDPFVEEEMEPGKLCWSARLHIVALAGFILLCGKTESQATSLHTGSSSFRAPVVHLDEKCADFTQLQERRNP